MLRARRAAVAAEFVIVLSRIDSRLIHGRIIEAWLPTSANGVADDEAAVDPLAKAAYALAVPGDVELVLRSPGQLDFQALAADAVRGAVS